MPSKVSSQPDRQTTRRQCDRDTYVSAHPELENAWTYHNNLTSNGPNETIDFNVTPEDRPPWLDEEKFKRGQEFAKKYLACIFFGELLGLPLLYTIQTALVPLIFTQKTATYMGAVRRYSSTTARHILWFSGDIWSKTDNEAKKSLRDVLEIHKSVCTRLAAIPGKQLQQRGTLRQEYPENDTLLRSCIKKDFEEFSSVKTPVPYNYTAHKIWLNQLDMAATQWSLLGLIVTFPTRFGVRSDDEGLDDFVHMWRGLGYLSGIKDEYNFCNAGLEGVRERTRLLIDTWFKPAFSKIDADWEHMSRRAIEGATLHMFLTTTLEAGLMFTLDAVNISAPNLKKNLSCYDCLVYYMWKLITLLVFWIPGFLNLVNAMVLRDVKDLDKPTATQLMKLKAKAQLYTKRNQMKSKEII